MKNIDDDDFKEEDHYGMMPPDGAFADSGNKYYLQKRPTVGGWVEGSEGYIQQTFLGASVVSFNISAGFNDTPNKLDVSLVVDEYNLSDKLPFGSGDDIYHNGQYDSFNPPPIGSPVFFKFGKNFASTTQAFARSYEMIYRFALLPNESEIRNSLKAVDRDYMDDYYKRSTVSGEDTPRAIKENHFLQEGQRPDLGYSQNQKPPQPEPNTIFADKSETYDPASVEIDPETMDIFDSPLTASRGKDHIVFGGILESYSEKKSAGGNPLYSVSVTDPKEILSNCTLILSDYAKTTYNNKNLFNIYGFLEHEIKDSFKEELIKASAKVNMLTRRDMLNDDKNKQENEFINLEDCYLMKEKVLDPSLRTDVTDNPQSDWVPEIGQRITEISSGNLSESKVKYWFPVTGFGMSRRSEKGMPIYRVMQSLPFMNYFMPQEYKDAGYGGSIDFRGFKFALNIDGLNDLFLDDSLIKSIDVDFNTNKKCPAKTNADVLKDIYIDSEDVTVLDLIQQIAGIFNKDFVVELLPPIDKENLDYHVSSIREKDPINELLEVSKYNEGILHNIQGEIEKTGLDDKGQEVKLKDLYTENDFLTGIIAITFIDKNTQPTFNEISKFLQNNQYENAEVGFDLINEATDKFLVGAQKVDLYFFSSDRDRDTRLQIMSKNPEGETEEERKENKGVTEGEIKRLEKDKWTFQESLKRQVLPYYGELAKGVASIPVGDGPFQQIVLNTESLNAFGVGEYYLATEMELRAAMVSFEQWSEFILKYNRRYVEGFVSTSDERAKGKAEFPYPPPSDEDKEVIKNLLRNTLAVDPDGIDPDPDIPLDQQTLDDINNMRCGVSVPRSVIVSNKNWYADAKQIWEQNEDDVSSPSDKPIVDEEKKSDLRPASPCFPPYGYPVYYGRADAIGILKPSDIGRLSNNTQIVQFFYDSLTEAEKERLEKGINGGVYDIDTDRCEEILKNFFNKNRINPEKSHPKRGLGVNTDAEIQKIKDFINYSKTLCDNNSGLSDVLKLGIKPAIEANGNYFGFVNSIIRLNLANAKKIHTFIKDIANEHLGKSFLVKLPQKSNIRYTEKIKTNSNKTLPNNGMVIETGPFGFKPIAQSGKIIPDIGDINFDKEFNYDFLFTRHEYNAPEPNIKYNASVDDILLNYSGNYIGFEIDSGLTSIDLFKHELGLSGVFDYEPIFKGSGLEITRYNSSELITPFEKEIKYSVGSFKPRYNPFIDNWDFNYLPQSKGGFYDFGISNLLIDDLLYPIDATKLRTEENRISPYVIYHHSQLLHFQGGNSNSIIQEKTDGHSVSKMMDLSTLLDNVGTEELQLDNPLNSYTEEAKGKYDPNFAAAQEHIAYIKCNVEETLYFAPRFCLYEELPVAASKFKLAVGVPASLDYITEDVIEGEDQDTILPSGKEKIVGAFINHVFVPDEPETPTSLDRREIVSLEYVSKKTCDKGVTDTRNLVIESKASLNSEHIYALVKLPTRPVPMFDRRFSDGPHRSTNPVTVAKIWNRDTIKGGGPWEGSLSNPPALKAGIEKEKLKYITNLGNDIGEPLANEEVIPLGNPEILIDFVHPSPVIPDVIALPLLSKQDCYGPWLSNRKLGNTSVSKGGCDETFADIGGKVLYEKDENLSPWKFDGHENMNKAGEIQVAFSNSLMLFSEKGSFTTPGIPPEVYIGRPLFDNSPIIDGVSLSVDENGIKTTVSMEVFSKKFGKTEKQRQEQLSRLTREDKQKRQIKNRLIRAGADVPEAGKQLQGLINTIGKPDLPVIHDFTSLETKNTVYDSVVASVVPQKQKVMVYNQSGVYPDSGPPKETEIIKSSNTASFQKKGYLQEAQSHFTDVNELNKSLQRTGGALLNDIYFPFDESVYNPYMTNVPYVDIDAITRRTS